MLHTGHDQNVYARTMICDMTFVPFILLYLGRYRNLCAFGSLFFQQDARLRLTEEQRVIAQLAVFPYSLPLGVRHMERYNDSIPYQASQHRSLGLVMKVSKRSCSQVAILLDNETTACLRYGRVCLTTLTFFWIPDWDPISSLLQVYSKKWPEAVTNFRNPAVLI